MTRITITTEIVSEQPGVYHIPGVHNMQQTLCGYVDCAGAEDHSAAEHPCNCVACIDALNEIKAMRFPKHYFKEPPMAAEQNNDAERAALLPCPFCGSANIAHHTFAEDDSRDFVMCSDCGVYAQRNDCEADPVEVWNRRPSAPIGEDGLPELPSDDKLRKLWNQANKDGTAAWSSVDCETTRHIWQLRKFYEAVARDVVVAARVYQRKVDEKIIARRDAEIADLHAQLARQSQEPAAWMVGRELFISRDAIPPRLLPPLGNPVPLYAAPPLSSEQQGPDLSHAYSLADCLYSAGYDDRRKERDYDPRATKEWQDVVDAIMGEKEA